MSYGSNQYRKDNPRWANGNAMETPRVPGVALRPGPASAIAVAWLIGLPHRAGRRIYAANDAEARWWHWQVTERRGGLRRQYRDRRFDLLQISPESGTGGRPPALVPPGRQRLGGR
jgi:hypothetical protein